VSTGKRKRRAAQMLSDSMSGRELWGRDHEKALFLNGLFWKNWSLPNYFRLSYPKLMLA